MWVGPTATLHPHGGSPHVTAALFAPLVAIDPATPEEQMYLDKLARELPSAQGLQGHLDLEVAAARG